MGYRGSSNYDERDKLFQQSMQDKPVDKTQVKKGLEDLFELAYVAFGLDEMRLKCAFQIGTRGGFDELRQRLDDALFGIVDVGEFIEEKITESFCIHNVLWS